MAKKVIFESNKVKIELFDSIEEMKSLVNYGPATKEEYEARTNAAKEINYIGRKNRKKGI